MIGAEVIRPRRIVDEIRSRVEDPRGLLRAAGRELIEYEVEVFATRAFGAWAPLAVATIKSKNSRRVLVDTGGLLRDLTSAGSLRYRGESVSLLTRHPGAEHLEAGARGTPVRDPAPMPPRREVAEWSRNLLGFLVDEPAR